MSEIDKLFQKKLSSFEKTVPPPAWDRIAGNLDKKNHKALWLKIAAGICITITASFIIWNMNSDTVDTVAAAEKQDQPKTVSRPAVSHSSKTKAQSENPEAPTARAPISKKQLAPNSIVSDVEPIKNNGVISRATEQPIAAVQQETIVRDSAQRIEEVVAATELNSTATALTTPSTETNAVTLVYSAEEVNAKYLNKNYVSEATPEDKKPSTLRKLLDKAYDLKHNQDPFGELREKKNEILALNFKNEKERSQNR